MKIIILGAGRVGQSVADSLVSERNDITVIGLEGQTKVLGGDDCTHEPALFKDAKAIKPPSPEYPSALPCGGRRFLSTG